MQVLTIQELREKRYKVYIYNKHIYKYRIDDVWYVVKYGKIVCAGNFFSLNII